MIRTGYWLPACLAAAAHAALLLPDDIGTERLALTARRSSRLAIRLVAPPSPPARTLSADPLPSPPRTKAPERGIRKSLAAIPRHVSEHEPRDASEPTQLPDVSAPPAVSELSGVASDAPKLRRDLIRPRYPRLSRRRGEAGSVQLLVALGSDGRVGEIELARSSGFRRLDRAAFEAVREAARSVDFVPPASKLPRSEMIEIEFRLESAP